MVINLFLPAIGVDASGLEGDLEYRFLWPPFERWPTESWEKRIWRGRHLVFYTGLCQSESRESLLARRRSSDDFWLLRSHSSEAENEQDVQEIPSSVYEKDQKLSTCSRKKSSHVWQDPWTPLQKAYSPLDSGKKKPTRDWLTQKHVSLVKAVSSESKGITDSAKTILDEEDYFVKEVDRYLNHNDFLNLRKKEIQYKKWLERVSEPLLHKIEDKVDSQSSEEIEERKRNQLALYLNYCNKKGNVVFEDYDASEYDPFFLKTHTNYWKVSTPPFKDPLLKEVQGKSLEKGIIQQCETGRIYSAKEMNELHKAKLPPLPLGRQRWDAVEWLKIAPGYIDSEVHQRKRRRMTRNQNKGTLDFKAWSDTACLPILWKEGMHIHQVKTDFCLMQQKLSSYHHGNFKMYEDLFEMYEVHKQRGI
ncbi:protein FAM228B [Alligator mississippiensis]|uniref:Protein FAM228B n=1 Tax=Alligator mississippiensis TaxID=8496 RepID=A0A151PIJ5_ALLMI|nr:protein FAM228B [Alligator mississippiensis]